jgi:carbamoyl-phosphate synthase large subunit
MIGRTLGDLRREGLVPANEPVLARMEHVAVKEAVLPFVRFPGVDTVLGPEMKSTGEVMGIDRTFAMAYAKAEEAADARLPRAGTVFVSVRDRDKRTAIMPARQLVGLGFDIIATEGTAETLRRNGIEARTVAKLGGGAPHVGDLIERGEVALIVNTPAGSGPRRDGDYIRTAAVRFGVPCITTLAGMQAAVQAITDLVTAEAGVTSLQEFNT